MGGRSGGSGEDSAKVQIGAGLLCKGAKVEASVSGGGWRPRVAGGGREIGQTVQRCNCGGAACKGAKVSAGTTSWPVDKLTGGQGSKYLAQRETGDRIVGWGHWVGLTILGRPGGRAGMLDPTRDRYRLCRDAVPTLPSATKSRGGGGWRLGTA